MSSDDTSKLVISKIKQIDDTTLQNYGLKNENEFYLITDDKLPIDVGDKKIVLSANATNDHDVINKSYIDDRLSKSGLLHSLDLNSGVERVNNFNPVNGNINVYNLVRPLADGISYLKLISEESYETIDQIALTSDLSNYVSHVELNQRLPAEFETRLKSYLLVNTWNTQNGIKTQEDLTYLSTNILNVSSITDTKRSELYNELTSSLNIASVKLSDDLSYLINNLSSKSVYLVDNQEISGYKSFKEFVKYLDIYDKQNFDYNSSNETLTPKKYVDDLKDELNDKLSKRITTLDLNVNEKLVALDQTTVKTINRDQIILGKKTFIENVNYGNYNFNIFELSSNQKTLVPKGYVVDTQNIISSTIKNLDDYNVKLSGEQYIDGNKIFKQYINYDNKYTDKETFKTETSADTLVPKQFVLDIEELLNARITKLLSTRMARNIGDIFYTTRLDTFNGSNIMLNGAVKCDGSEYNINSTNLKYYFDRGLIAFKTFEEFNRDTSLNRNNFGYFIWDGADRVRVPKLDDVFIQSEINDYKFNGHYIKPSLPAIFTKNITQIVTDVNVGWGPGPVHHSGSSLNDFSKNVIKFNNNLNSIYGKSDTVQPPAVKLVPMVQITNEVQDPAMLSAETLINQFNNVLGEVNNLLDKLIN